MKKKIFRVVLTAFAAILLLAALAVACSAEKTLVAEGYCVTKVSGAAAQTNIKWEIFTEGEAGEQTIYFTIDKTKNDTNTVLHAKDRDTGDDIAYYKKDSGARLPWGDHTAKSNSAVIKAVIGEGITEISGTAFAYSAIKTVEIPKTLVKLTSAAFNRASKLDTVNITGEEENPGVVNLKYITDIPNNTFGGENRIIKYVFNPDYSGAFGNEAFSKNNKLREIEIPAGVTALGDNIFTGSPSLTYLTILGKNTVLTEKTFGGLNNYPKIIGYVGSAAEQFAKTNGHTFVNIETNEVVHKGTKPLTENNDPLFLDTLSATAHGHLTGYYENSSVVDTYWAYYADTKTLKIVSGVVTYNESGRLSYADDGKGWSDYLDQIEHVVVGDYILKLSNEFCFKMTNLKSIELSSSVTEMGSGDVFGECFNLSTIYVRGKEKTEGLADFSGMKLNDVIKDTKIKTLKLSEKNEELYIMLPSTLEKIITPHYNSEFLDNLCKENLYDLQDANNPSNIKKYFVAVELDPSWIMCGPSAAFSFDEATGTLTVHGKGIIDDIDNYYGGGSKFQPWFSIRDNVKHIVITENITVIGKYAFCEFVNLETVCLPNVEKISILNAAFEKCHNLKSVYVEGTDPIEGTFDLRLMKDEIPAWTFAYDYLVANVILDESVTKIGKTTFEENLGVNLKGIYGVPGSYAEEYATKNELTFCDISKGMPTPVTCTAPEPKDTETSGDDTTATPDSGDDTIAPDTTVMPDTTNVPDTDSVGTTDVNVDPKPADGGNDSVILIVVIVVVVLAVAACVTVFAIKTKKNSPKNDK